MVDGESGVVGDVADRLRPAVGGGSTQATPDARELIFAVYRSELSQVHWSALNDEI